MDTAMATHLDLANHHADATEEDIRRLCQNVLKYGFNAGFVNPCHVAIAKETLGDKAKVGTAISFPLGQDTREMKIFAAKEAIRLGADELDIIPNHGLILASIEDVTTEMKSIVAAARSVKTDIVIKFILESGLCEDLLRHGPAGSELERRKACQGSRG